MPFEFCRTEIPEVMLIRPVVFRDRRGFFVESYKRSEFAEHGISDVFVQSNHSHSAKGVLRGLHYQREPKAQAKLVQAAKGELFDVVVDLRRGSPTYGKWVGTTLSAQSHTMIYVPAGFAHGFCVTGEDAEVLYFTNEEYEPSCEAGVIWNDPDLAIAWPCADPDLSERDRNWPRLRDTDNNFDYVPRVSATNRARDP
jgi:dTDP-4-dehydrorhamnose 3,5-epimerase